MRLLGEIYHDDGLDLTGRTVTRRAVRAIILRDREMLMIHSPVNGDYKFPGGGVEPSKTDEEALAREVLEECGTDVNEVGKAYGEMVSYRAAREEGADIFKMTSRNYRCTIHDRAFGEQQLDRYEEALEFRPVWVDIRDAVQKNEILLASPGPPRWTKRETFVLDHLITHSIHD